MLIFELLCNLKYNGNLATLPPLAWHQLLELRLDIWAHKNNFKRKEMNLQILHFNLFVSRATTKKKKDWFVYDGLYMLVLSTLRCLNIRDEHKLMVNKTDLNY